MSLENWRGRLGGKYGVRAVQVFGNWLGWLGVNGGSFEGFSADELVTFQRGAVGEDKFKILDLVQRWASKDEGLRVSTKRYYYTVIRSFFLHNRAELPRDRSFRLRSSVPPSVGVLSLEDFKILLSSCNLMYRAVFLCMFQGGMGVGEWSHWNRTGWDSLEAQLFGGRNPVKVDLPGRKMNRNIKPFYTMLGGDAVKALRDWLPDRPPGAKTIFVNQWGRPLTEIGMRRYWDRHMQRLGLVKPVSSKETGRKPGSIRHGRNLHELRGLFRTRWQKSGRAPEVAEFMMGHEIDPLGYNKAMQDESYVRYECKQASSWLNILSQEPDKIPRDEVLEQQEEQDKRMAEMEEQLRQTTQTLEKILDKVLLAE